MDIAVKIMALKSQKRRRPWKFLFLRSCETAVCSVSNSEIHNPSVRENELREDNFNFLKKIQKK